MASPRAPRTPFGRVGALEREQIVSPGGRAPFRPGQARSRGAASSSVLRATGMPDIRSWHLVAGKGTVRQKNQKGIEHQFKSTAQNDDIRAAVFGHTPSQELSSFGDYCLKTTLCIGRLPFTVVGADLVLYHETLDGDFAYDKPSRYFGAECTCLQLRPDTKKVVLKAYGGEGSSVLGEWPCTDLRPNFPLRIQVIVSPSRHRGDQPLPGCRSFLSLIVNDRRLLSKFLMPSGVFLAGPIGLAVALVDVTVSSWQVFENGKLGSTRQLPPEEDQRLGQRPPRTTGSARRRLGTSPKAVDPSYGEFKGQKSLSRSSSVSSLPPVGDRTATGLARSARARRSLPAKPGSAAVSPGARGPRRSPSQRRGPPAHAMRAASQHQHQAQIWSNGPSPAPATAAARPLPHRPTATSPRRRTATAPRPRARAAPPSRSHRPGPPPSRHAAGNRGGAGGSGTGAYHPPSRGGGGGGAGGYDLHQDDQPARRGTAGGGGGGGQVAGAMYDLVMDMMLTPKQCKAAAPKNVVALTEAKRLLHEACVLPLIIPEHFQGIREPWRGILLFGPPGTGKTMLARLAAAECSASFFNCSASSLLSSLYGQSEKVVAALFSLAREHAPSIVFFDEIDSLMSERGSSREHEASRRVKSQLLSELDGIQSTPGQEGEAPQRVVIIATTNRPWDLDDAMRRRLEKRIYIGLPDTAARRELFSSFLRGVPMAPDVNLEGLAGMTQGYSGADVRMVCREAALKPVRALIQGKSADEIRALSQAGQLSAAITMRHLMDAIGNTKPSVNEGTLPRYHDWMAQFGSK